MNLTVLGSGSSGNAIAITAAGVSVLLDVGFGPRVLVGRARRAGVDLRALVGVVLTHEHGDHARGALAVARKARCPIYASQGTLGTLGDGLRAVRHRAIRPHHSTRIGPFALSAVRTNHDAAEPLAICVTGPDGKEKVGLAYDLGRPSTALRYMLRDATCLLIEANHDEILLRTGPYPATVRQRIGGSRGHLSNRAAGRFLADICHRRLKAVVLLHLSERCNRPELAVAEVWAHLKPAGYRGDILVATQDEPLESLRLAPDPHQLEFGFTG